MCFFACSPLSNHPSPPPKRILSTFEESSDRTQRAPKSPRTPPFLSKVTLLSSYILLLLLLFLRPLPPPQSPNLPPTRILRRHTEGKVLAPQVHG